MWYNFGPLTMTCGLEDPQGLLSVGKTTRNVWKLDGEWAPEVQMPPSKARDEEYPLEVQMPQKARDKTILQKVFKIYQEYRRTKRTWSGIRIVLFRVQWRSLQTWAPFTRKATGARATEVEEEEEDEEEEGEGRMNERTRRFLARRHPQCKHQTRQNPTQDQHKRGKHCQLEAGSRGCLGSEREGWEGCSWHQSEATARSAWSGWMRRREDGQDCEVVATRRSKQRSGRCKHNPDFWTLRISDSRIWDLGSEKLFPLGLQGGGNPTSSATNPMIRFYFWLKSTNWDWIKDNETTMMITFEILLKRKQKWEEGLLGSGRNWPPASRVMSSMRRQKHSFNRLFTKLFHNFHPWSKG